ncbi:hypothetical protein OS493_005640 [Desmophyllum pertusum]|uniref:beta-N-acetylhexosaminidase n=1 Tax=Desmophyllum pertusum TaxID=174260 RepID=A0A9W9YVD1_9CNID|nr:hypothetical protein OS493_005640 [Desmophyllum pertusum]
MMDDEEALKESVSNLRSAILLSRTDIIRSILSTAAEYREEDGLFGDDDEEEAQLGVPKQFYYDEYDDPYDILKMMMNYVDNDAGTCLHLATKLGYADAVRALLAAGSDPTIPNSEGATSFDYCTDKPILGVYNEELLQAAANSNVPRVRKLLKAGVSVNAGDGATSDNKALHWAASYGNADIVKLLCDNEAKVNITNRAGVTPLHDAVNRGDIDIAKILLEHGAASDIKAKEGACRGQTAIELVNTEEMRELLTSPVVKEAKSVTNGSVNQHTLEAAESLTSKISTLSLTSPSTSSLPSTPSSLSHLQMLSGMTPPANSEPLDPSFLLVWPHPQEITQIKGTRFFPTSVLPVVLFRELQSDHFQELCEIWNTVEDSFQQIGYTLDLKVVGEASMRKGRVASSIECHVCPNSFSKSESYRITISAVKVVLTASDLPGLWYAVNTLLQILRLFHGKGIPQIQINDWPDLKFRGVLWDVSTGRVPTLETVYSLIDLLSAMKINQLQLYMQNTFSYIGHEAVWRNTTPYNASDIIKIDSYCKRRYVELVPHIESLSGFSQWLKFKSYKHLAEEEVEFDPRQARLPSCLCPTNEESINLVLGLHSQAFPCFSSTRFVHVGLDLAPEFGKGKSHLMAEAKGADEVYMSHLRSVHRSCRRHGRTLQFWANALHDDPEQLWNLPPGVIAMEYGHTLDHDFLKFCKPLVDAGVSFFVCPGTGSWNSVCGNTEESISVMSNAVQTAVVCNALGVLICDWSLPGHVNPLSVSIPALLAGAGLAWKAAEDVSSVRSSLPDVLSQHVFMDTSGTFGRALMDLGTTHSILLKDEAEESRDAAGNRRVHPVAHAPGSKLLWQILETEGSCNIDEVTSDNLQKVMRHIRQCHKSFIAADLKCKQKADILKELDVLVEILLFMTRICRTLLLNRKQSSSVSIEELPAISKTDLANKLLTLVDVYQKAYVLRNKQGGLLHALQLLQNFLQHLLPGDEK